VGGSVPSTPLRSFCCLIWRLVD